MSISAALQIPRIETKGSPAWRHSWHRRSGQQHQARTSEQGCDALRRLGYKPFYLDSILEQDLYFAGSPERRVRELEEMFARDDVRAIVCARGGYGANYLLGQLDPAKIAGHPKIFVGYSDITTLLTCFC